MEVIIPCLPFHPLFSISMHNIGFLHCFQIMCSFSFQWRHKKNWTTFFSSTFCRISLLRLLNFSYINFNKHWKVLPHSENSSHSPRRLNVFVDGEIVFLFFSFSVFTRIETEHQRQAKAISCVNAAKRFWRLLFACFLFKTIFENLKSFNIMLLEKHLKCNWEIIWN